MIRIAIGSTNPVKISAAKMIMERIWPEATFINLAVQSGVSAMPMSDEECLTGARNRAKAAKNLITADFGVGIEGGVQEENGLLMLTAWAVIINSQGQEGLGSSGRLPLPKTLANRVRSGEELGHVMDDILNDHNIKQKGGAVGALTAGLVSRQEALALGVAYALGPFVAPHIYFNP